MKLFIIDDHLDDAQHLMQMLILADVLLNGIHIQRYLDDVLYLLDDQNQLLLLPL